MFNQSNLALMALILAGLVFFWNIWLQISVFRMKRSYKKIFSGKNAGDLEKVILQNKGSIESLDKDIKDLYEINSKIYRLSQRGIHKVGVVRFNPFQDIGGNQSFCVAFLDADDSGAVISSLYGREGVRVYAKSILRGKSIEYPLTDEEKQAIKSASIFKGAKPDKKR